MPHSLPPTAPIRVLALAPSPLLLGALQRVLAASAEFEWVGRATNGRAGLELVERLRPDAICCATDLPLLSSAELTREIMSRFPTPILVLQAPDATTMTGAAAAILAEGAIDWIAAPAPENSAEFLLKLARTSRVRVVTRRRAPGAETLGAETLGAETLGVESLGTGSLGTGSLGTETLGAKASGIRALGVHAEASSPLARAHSRAPEREGARLDAVPSLIAVGASTGGPPVLLELLRGLCVTAPPVLCVQHIAHGFLDELVSWLGAQCRVELSIARGGEVVRPGAVYFPAEDRHLEISAAGRLSLSAAPPLAGHRPAVDVTFESVARAYGKGALAILLTGMGADGARGLAALREVGSSTWAQSPATCVVAGMPGQAIELGAASAVLSPAEMARRLAAF